MSIENFKPENWIISSNSALKLSLVNDENAVQFSPTFTYPIFGTEEQIFGYKDLVIHLAFDAVTFSPFLNIKYSSKFEGSEEEIPDIKDKLFEFLPENDTVFKDEEKWINKFQKEREIFDLPSKQFIVKEYSVDKEEFIIYKVNLQEPSIKKLHKRIQIFNLLFIEAASYIDDDDPNWDIFLTYNKSNKTLIGYVTTYRYWHYTGAKDFENSNKLKYRGKISQFLILPPYQNKGHGSNLYNSVVENWVSNPSVIEIAVEDPNESFDDLRDRNDLYRLYQEGLFESIPESKPIPQQWLAKNRSIFKIEKRQFSRLIEMILLSNQSENFEYQVKQRLLIKNADTLKDMAKDEILPAIQTSYDLSRDDYDRILSNCNFLRSKGEPYPKKLKQ
ncbi:Histone acetyltransferase type B catalytic subunit [Nakaseomyces bracarensis]|uniref:Histone acetyltransferase type B catalytic subunit n=1 Tax=Nakaseomyces bracarensis TaxID=273131 RepID=A0ABR4NXS1_9SACH